MFDLRQTKDEIIEGGMKLHAMYIGVCAENERLRIALHCNACRYRPELSDDEISAEIERIARGDEQRGDTK